MCAIGIDPLVNCCADNHCAGALTRLPDRLANQTSQKITIEITYTTPLATRNTITLTLEGDLVAETSTLLEADPELGIPANIVVLEASTFVVYGEGNARG